MSDDFVTNCLQFRRPLIPPLARAHLIFSTDIYTLSCEVAYRPNFIIIPNYYIIACTYRELINLY